MKDNFIPSLICVSKWLWLPFVWSWDMKERTKGGLRLPNEALRLKVYLKKKFWTFLKMDVFLSEAHIPPEFATATNFADFEKIWKIANWNWNDDLIGSFLTCSTNRISRKS